MVWAPHRTLKAGAKMATLRGRQSLTQTDVAERLQISRPVIVRIRESVRLRDLLRF